MKPNPEILSSFEELIEQSAFLTDSVSKLLENFPDGERGERIVAGAKTLLIEFHDRLDALVRRLVDDSDDASETESASS